MKKKEKKKIKIRKSVRQTYIMILLIIIIVSLYVLYNLFNLDNKNNFIKANLYEYNNNFLYSYDVNMLENDYITKENIVDGNAYVTDLISNVLMNMTYRYKSNQVSDIAYNYQIVGNLEAVYSREGEEQKVWKKTEILVPMKNLEFTGDTVEISENLDLNLKEKIEMLKGFQQDLSMQITTKYTILMEIVTNTTVDGKQVINAYSPNVVFEIGSKTTKITSDTEKNTAPQVITALVENNTKYSEQKTTIVTCIILIAIINLIVLIVKTENNNIVRNEYKLELNKILKNYEEKIVEVNNKVEIEEHNLVNLKEFDEIVKVSEELSKPILYWNNDKNEESWFCVVGNNIGYRYILKR